MAAAMTAAMALWQRPQDQWLPLASTFFSALLLLAVPLRLWQLRQASIKARINKRSACKLAVSLLYCLSRLLLMVFRWHWRVSSTIAADVDLVLGLAGAVAVALLSFREHSRAVRPSTVAILYLLASSFWDLIRLSAPLSSDDDENDALYRLFSMQAAVKMALLVLECQGKESILRDEYRQQPPEQLASVLSVTYFWWMHAVLAAGYRRLLSSEELPRIDGALEATRLRREMLVSWNQRVKPETSTTLPRVLLHHFSAPLLHAVLPRLFLVLFRFSQPLLINRAIAFVQRSSSEEEATSEQGFWIIVSAVIVYSGLATSTAVFQHRLDRLQVMIRGALIGLVHDKALADYSLGYDDASALTLMSNDVAGVEGAAAMLHGMWGQLLEAVVGFSMLAAQIGWVWPLPLVVIFFFTQTSRLAVKPMKAEQTAWNAATQKRISMTSAVLAAVKSVKMLGMQAAAENLILQLRDSEISRAKGVGWINVAYNASANALGMFTPVLTISLYALLMAAKGEGLDTKTAFTIVAILSMVTHPVNMVMTILPQTAALLSSFERIQTYLLAPSVHDPRATLASSSASAIEFRDVALADPKSGRPVLASVNLHVKKGSLVVCTGAVGSGKSLLIYAALGETAVQSGTVAIASKRVAFCAQAAWLPNRTIRDCILGLDEHVVHDPEHYEAVLDACCLREDLAALAHGDETAVGTSGQNLSGGQRQRVALARAAYARQDIVFLDDSFNALDARTQSSVVTNLLGPDGLLRQNGTTVFWATNCASFFHLADTTVLLADGTVQYQGGWETFKGSHAAFLHQIAQAEPHAATPEDATADAPPDKSRKTSAATSTPASDLARKEGDLSLYGYYFRAAGVANVVVLLASNASYSFFVMFPQYWLKWWTESSGHTLFYTAGYIGLLGVAWMSTNGIKWSDVIRVAPQSGKTLHGRLLHSVLGAPLAYFSQTDQGTILNRFGQDIQLVDKQISGRLGALGTQVFKLSMQAALLFAVQPHMSATLPAVAGIVYVVQKRYLRTSRQLRWLELESRSAVYFSFLETVQGLTTVRAFGWRAAVARDNSRCLDDAQRPLYLMLCLQRWLSAVLDAVVVGLAVGTVWLAVAPPRWVVSVSPSSGGQVGVALNIIIVANTTLLSLIQVWTDLEVSLGAVARLRETSEETPQEEEVSGSADDPVPLSWPTAGGIEFVDVTASYNHGEPVLRNVNLTIEPGQMAVICGRTGSGKSSLLMSLLRLLDVQGRILVDGVDLAGLPRAVVRQRAFVTVAQDAVLLPEASLRFHLDPSGTLPDAALTAALARTGLSGVLAGRDPQRLDAALSAFPLLSAGQTQLLALARALLQVQMQTQTRAGRQRPVLLLDEITASLDAAAEAVVYDVVEDVFVRSGGHTVLVVTHRLDGLARRLRPGRDLIVWMDKGVAQVEGV